MGFTLFWTSQYFRYIKINCNTFSLGFVYPCYFIASEQNTLLRICAESPTMFMVLFWQHTLLVLILSKTKIHTTVRSTERQLTCTPSLVIENTPCREMYATKENRNCEVWFELISFTSSRNIWLIYKNNVVHQRCNTLLEAVYRKMTVRSFISCTWFP